MQKNRQDHGFNGLHYVPVNQITSSQEKEIDDRGILSSEDNVQLLDSSVELLARDSSGNQITSAHAIGIDDRGILTSDGNVQLLDSPTELLVRHSSWSHQITSQHAIGIELLVKDFSGTQITSTHSIVIDDRGILTSNDNVKLLDSPVVLLVQDFNGNPITSPHSIGINDCGILTSDDNVQLLDSPSCWRKTPVKIKSPHRMQ